MADPLCNPIPERCGGANAPVKADRRGDLCAGVYERCRQAADCCDVGIGAKCINSVCAAPPPIP